MCGEKFYRIHPHSTVKGSPPRVRGKAERVHRFRFAAGITPACAGKSPAFRRSPRCAEDHPRVCGEKKSKSVGCWFDVGSPPRVRGKAAGPVAPCSPCRITPACAGKSSYVNNFAEFAKDHPRVCGEKFAYLAAAKVTGGSPPRVRGKGLQRKSAWCRMGITPACAGKRVQAIMFCGKSKDHPRVCGEKQTAPLLHQSSRGSPPRVRGKDCCTAASTAAFGITPACAGKRPEANRICNQCKDHPRVCGEKF